ncbi:hypothetical protein AMECASPLE_022999 [Ameca splendens]|uniref:Uncharacterized protein n=1 Tax=Ameca splendens TaxID=208324 RepID=A0ABV0Y4K8_9TELE
MFQVSYTQVYCSSQESEYLIPLLLREERFLPPLEPMSSPSLVDLGFNHKIFSLYVWRRLCFSSDWNLPQSLDNLLLFLSFILCSFICVDFSGIEFDPLN